MKWQIWAALIVHLVLLIVHLVLRHMKFTSRWTGSYTRFVGLIRAATREKVDLNDLLKFYWIAGPPDSKVGSGEMPCLPGFKKLFLAAMGQQDAKNQS